MHGGRSGPGDSGGAKALADGLAGNRSPIFAGRQEKPDGTLFLSFDYAATDPEDATDAE